MSVSKKTKKLKEEKEINKWVNQLRKTSLGIDKSGFAKTFASLINTLNNSGEAYYILDIHTMQYVYLNPQFFYLTGYPGDLIVQDGWNYIEDIALRENRLGLCVMLKEIYKRINALKEEERKKARIYVSYRIENNKKETIKILQMMKIIALDSNGAPALELGRMTDITAFKPDNKISATIEINNTKIAITPSELLPQLNHYTTLQLEHAQHLADGKTVYEISELTGKSKRNVEQHLHNFRINANAKTIEQAISKGKDEGVIK